MKYALLIYAPPEGAEGAKSIEGVYDSWLDYTVALRESGALLAAEQLDQTDTATSVSLQAGERLLTDGPFMETKEILGGFLVNEARDLNEGVRIAAGIPLAKLGFIEVRPFVDFSQPRPQL